MGLDDFKTSSSSSGGGSSSGTSGSRSTRSQFYRCIWNGKETLAEGYKELTIEDKDRWEQMTDFIENNFGLTEDDLMELPHEDRYQIVRNTQKKLFFNAESDFDVKRECLVCGKAFIFPDDWDFFEYEDNVFCTKHSVREANDALEEEGIAVRQ